MNKKGMSKKHQRRLTLVGVASVMAIWMAALALLFSQPLAPSDKTLLPTLASPLGEVVALPDTGASVNTTSPTLLPTSLPVELPAESLPDTSLVSAPANPAPQPSPTQPTLLDIPDEPVPNSRVIRFAPETTQQARLAYIASLGGQIVQEIKPLNTVVISLPDGADASIQSQGAQPGVLENEPDYYAGALYEPNDALAAGQWGLEVVKAPQAWDILPQPTPGVTVAVVDSGICASHADLVGRIAPDGWDFVQNDNTPQDEYGHGCAVSGIIAANSNNTIGIAGVAPNATVLPLRVLDASGIGLYSNVAAAIVYAVDNGAGAINLSLGGPNPSAVLQGAVNYAEAHGVTVIAAAGNNGAEQIYYPAAYPAVVAVGSVSQNLQRSPFSNYGPGLDLYAPGDGIMTTSLDGSFQTYSGTSVAAPYVSGVWALRKAMDKELVLDGGIVSALYANDIPTPTEEPPSELCRLSDMQAAEAVYFNLVGQKAAQPGSVAADQIEAARSLYLSLAGQCANTLYTGTLTVDGGGIIPISGEIAPLFQIFGTKWQQESPDETSPQIGAAFNRGQPPAEPGGIINYSFMPTGVSLAAKEAVNGGGANSAITAISDLPTNLPTQAPVPPQCDLQARIREAFDAWESVANVDFREITETGLVPFGASGAVGDMRIGAQIIDGMRGELAHAYFPPPDPEIATSTRAGDIFFDRAEVWGCAPGEIQIPDGPPIRVLDIGWVTLHELGHALGMQHEALATAQALMNPTYNPGLIEPETDAVGNIIAYPLETALENDDQGGARAIYGGIGLSAPSLQPIADTANDNTPTFPWRDTVVSGSDYFEIEIYNSNGGQPDALLFEATTTGGNNPADPPAKSFTIPDTLESLPYLWRVRAFDAGAFGEWSDYAEFAITVGVPALLRPAAGEVLSNGDIQFQWGQAANATSYLLQISTEAEFATEPFIFNDIVPGLSFTPPTLADGTYYWRVQAQIATGPTPFSAIQAFTVDSTVQIITLLSPDDEIRLTTSTNISLEWAALADVSEYQVRLDTSENFVGLVFLDKVFLDKVFLDKVFLDKVFLDKVFLDKVFLDKVFLDKVFLDKVFLDKVFLDKVFLDKVFLDKVFLDKVFLDKVFLDKVFLDKVFLDKVFLDKVEAGDISDGEVTLNFNTMPFSEGVHYWQVRPRLADGTYGPWSVSRSFEVRTQTTKVVINEIKLSDPSWIEFHNTGETTANMAGWQFFAYGPSGETQLLYTFADGFSIPVGGYAVLYEGVGTDTDKVLYTGGSQIDWPLTAQGLDGLTLTEPNALNGFGTVVPAPSATTAETQLPGAESASPPPAPGQSTILIGPNGPMTAQGVPLLPPVAAQAQATATGVMAETPAAEDATANPSVSAQALDDDLVTAQTIIPVNTTSMAVANDGQCSLIEAITAANTDTASGAAIGECPAGAGADTISLGTSQTYTLTGVNNDVGGLGFNGLPAITTDIFLYGNNSTITRDDGAPEFRIFYVTDAVDLTLNDVTISNGRAESGGAIANTGSLTVNDSTISNNIGELGGGIANYSTLTITNSTIVDNTAISGGGLLHDNGNTNITNTVFANNTATSDGGAIYSQEGTVTITNSTIAGNNAEVTGGIFSDGTLDLNFVTVTANNGGGVRTNGAGINVTNSIIAAQNSGPNCAGLINSSGVNYSTVSACAGFTLVTAAELNLGALADNGGPTQTVALGAGSFAIDAVEDGDCETVEDEAVTTDQRGIARPQGANCDAGAYEVIELVGTTFTVNVTTDADDGTCTALHCTLREAINAANALLGTDTIAFTIPGAGPHTIQPTSALPTISDPVIINGETEPDFVDTPIIELDGSLAGDVHGLIIEAEGGSTVRGLVINGFGTADAGYGIYILNNGGNTIQNNYIGTDVTGTLDRGNHLAGIIVNNSSANLIGGSTDGSIPVHNVISGNGSTPSPDRHGILIVGDGSTGNIVAGNFIGTDVTGTQPLGNFRSGVAILFDASNNLIGNNGVTGLGNVISANTESGVFIQADANFNTVAGNRIGTNGAGDVVVGIGSMGNGLNGVSIDDASQNTIGGSTPPTLNIIAGNAFSGVGISNADSSGNVVLGNSIFENGGLGIDLNIDGVTPNDDEDDDLGPNGLQNFPIITSATTTGSSINIVGTINSTPNDDFTIQFLSSPTCDPSGNGEGEVSLGQINPILTNGSGDGSFDVTLPVPVAAGQFITTTATNSLLNTSEFSTCVTATSSGQTFTVNTTLMTDDGVCDLANCTLIEAINAANTAGGANTIELGINQLYTLNVVNNVLDGSNGLPNIASDITINGNGSTIARSSVGGTPNFRLLHVAIAGDLTLNTVTVRSGNGGGGDGSGIYNLGSLAINNSTIANNLSGAMGGGLFNSGTATIIRSTISGNSGSQGGGLFNSGTMTLTNSTIAGNTASSTGAGIHNEGTLTLNHSTVASNFAEGGNQIFNDPDGSIEAKNTIVARAVGGGTCLNLGTISGFGGNFSTDASCTGFTVAPAAQLNLGLLANNGGSTQTSALGAGSVAIDAITAANCTTVAGAAVTTDQRGIARPQGAQCDAGAYEVQVADTPQPGPTLTVNTTAATDDGVCGTLNCSLIEAINAANSLAGANTIELGTSQTYTLTAVNNTDILVGPNGLPTITTEITVNGNGSIIVRSNAGGTPDFRILHISGGNLTLSLVTISNGRATTDGGAIYNGGGTLNISGSNLSNNVALREGGGLWSDGTAIVTNTSFTSNSATSGWGGGGVANYGTLTLNSSTFTSNSTPNANGGGAVMNEAGGSVTIEDSAFTDNSGLFGGAILNHQSATIRESSFIDNISIGDGGAIYNGHGASTAALSITNSTFGVNNAGGNGGSLYNDWDATATITHATFFLGAAVGSGGNIRVNTGALDLQNSIVASGAASSGPEISGTVNSLDYNLILNLGGATITGATANNLTGQSPELDALTGTPAYYPLSVSSPAIDYIPPASCTGVTTDQRGVTRPQGTNCDIGAYEAAATDTPQPGPDFVVNNSTDVNDGVCGTTHCTLREAVNAANANPNPSVITFDFAPGSVTITLAGTELPAITTDVTITSTPGRFNISGNSQSRIFNVAATGTLTTNWLILISGSADTGGAILNAGTLNLVTTSLFGNVAGDGGAITNTGVADISGSNLFSNLAFDDGGAIVNSGGTMTLENSSLFNNTTSSGLPGSLGGAIFNSGSLTIDGSSFTNNSTASGSGGAIANQGEGGLTITNSTFSDGNQAALGGALYTIGAGGMTLINVTLSGNTATSGGGIYVDSTATLNFVTVTNNTGGGIFSNDTPYNIKNSIVADQQTGVNCDGTVPSGIGNFTDNAICGGGFTNTSTPLIEGLAYNNGRVYTHALTETSPARDAAADCATVSGAVVATDARDIDRPQGTQCDAGAYEFGGDLHVTTTAMIQDGADGKCSLPEAIIAANTGDASGIGNGECVPANTSPEVITLAPSQTYRLTQVDNTIQGPNGLPPITFNNLYLYMNGSTITRASDAPDFRIFYIAPGGLLYFTSAGTVSGGLLSGVERGAGILNQGNLLTGGVTFENNVAAGDGGALYNDVGANSNLFNNAFRNNQAGQGGAIFNAGTVTNNNNNRNRFEGNGATGNGGAVYNAGGAVNLGYGIFLNNQADGAGGGVFNSAGDFTALNATFSGNQAANGAAVFLNSGDVNLNFSTLAENTTTSAASGAVVYSDGSMTVANSIVANNPGGNCAGLPSSGSGNLQFPGLTCGVGFGANNPLLAAKVDDTFLVYYPLLIGSPAIDAVSTVGCPSSDGRFFARPIGLGCDIGSFEGAGIALTGDLTVTTTQQTVNSSDGLCSLTEAINAANSGFAAEGSVQGECVPAGDADTITLGTGLTYTLSTINNTLPPPNGSGNGLPAITSPITINANGSTITRSSEANFRILYVDPDGSLTLNNATLSNGFGDPGGAIFADGALTLNAVSIADNDGSSGGGLFLNGANIINNSAITGNQALSPDGGGIFVSGNATLTLTNSTVAGNSAQNFGGGIVTGFGSTVVVNIINSTIANNTAASGGGINVFGGSVTVYNTIIANNTGGNCAGAIGSGGAFTSSIQWPGFDCTDTITSADPLFGPLTGSSAYLPLNVGSPAIDNADPAFCPATDQRGVPRVAADCDIGAVEVTEAPALVPGTTGGAAALISPVTRDFVRFGDTTLGPVNPDEWTGANVALPDISDNIGRDPASSDTNHVSDWAAQRETEGGQNFTLVLINEVYTGSNDYVELVNPRIETANISGWELKLYDANDQLIPAFAGAPYSVRFPDGTLLRPGAFLVVGEQDPGGDSDFIASGPINWDDANPSGAVALTNGLTPVDFMRFGSSQANQLVVAPPAGTTFEGVVQSPLPNEAIGRNSVSDDTNKATDWLSQVRSASETNPAVTPPANDSFSGATTVDTLPFRDTGDTTNASAVNDPALDCGASVGHTVWYQFTPTTTGQIRLQTDGSNFDSVLAVFTLNALNTPVQIPGLCSQRDAATGSRLSFTATAGVTYYILIGGHLNASGQYIFSVNAPLNDDLFDAVNVSGLAALPFRTSSLNALNELVSNTNTRAASTIAADPILSCSPTAGRSVWYSYNAASATKLRLRTANTQFDTAIAVYVGQRDGTALNRIVRDSLVEVACNNDDATETTSDLGFTPVPGTEYFFQVSGNSDQGGDLLFEVSVFPTPANDLIVNAYPVTKNALGTFVVDIGGGSIVPTPFAEDTTGATSDDDPVAECGLNPGATVWFRYTADTTDTVVFQTFGSKYDTTLSIWIEDTGNPGTFDPLACNDDVSVNTSSRLTLGIGTVADVQVVQTTTYYIGVSGYFGETGDLLFNAFTPSTTPPGNDLVTTPFDIMFNPDDGTYSVQGDPANETAPFMQDTTGAASTLVIAGEGAITVPAPTCGDDVGYTVWYRYAAPERQQIVFDAVGSDFDTVITAYVLQGNQLVEVGCNDDFEGRAQSKLTLNTAEGVTLYLLFGGFKRDRGNLDLSISQSIAVTSFTVVNADVGAANGAVVLDPLADGAVVQLSTLPDAISIRANTDPLDIGSVKFELSAGGSSVLNTTDNDVPYALTGNNDATDGSYIPWIYTPNTLYTLKATPYVGLNGLGRAGTPLTITFIISDNQPPMVTAAADPTIITLPVNSVNLTATASDDDLPAPANLTFTWSAVNPPAPVTFGNANTLNTTATFTAAGAYTLRFTASDGQLSSSADVVVTVQPLIVVNQPPVADAGADQTVQATRPALKAAVTLDGSGSTDDGTITSYFWTEGGTQIATGATASVDLSIGLHTITLTVTDNNLAQDTDTVDITVNPPPNTPPVADAGQDQVVTDTDKNGSEQVTLNASASTDADGNNTIKTYIWTEVIGGVTTQIATGANPTLPLNIGTHAITLTITDDLGALDSDDVMVKVNVPPTAHAGDANRTITDTVPLGAEDVALNGSLSSDSDGTIMAYSWSENGVGFSNLVAPTRSLALGSHTIRLTVTDNDFATGFTEITINVISPPNQPPMVTANANPTTITLPTNSVNLSATASDDGLPTTNLTFAWSAVNPPAPVTFGSANALNTTATFTAAGAYTLRFTASDGQLSGSADVVVTVMPDITTPIIVDDQIELSSDDVNEDGNSYDATNPQLWVGTGRNVNKSFLGLRFNNLEIPKGAVITEAHIEVYTPTAQWIRMRILVAAENVDDSATFTSATRPSTRIGNATAARLDYRSDTPWPANTWNDIGDVKAVIQEIVNRQGWQPGNSLTILIKGLGGQWGRKFVTSYDGNPAFAPRLFVTYAGGPPPPNNLPVVTVNQPIPPAFEGVPISIPFTVTDADNNPVMVTASPGTVQQNGANWTWNYTPLDGPANVPVAITATDSRGGMGSATFNLLVSNVAPTASFSAQPASPFPNNPVTLTFSNPVDVAADLVNPPGLTYTVDCGNGSTQIGAVTTCTYAITGPFIVRGIVTDKDGGATEYTVNITVSETPTEPVTIMPQVNSGSDDVNENGASFEVNNPTVWVGTEGNTGQSYTGLRFNNVAIPQNATITEAYLEFYVTSNQWINVDTLIAGEKTANSQTFTAASRPSGRAPTDNRLEHHSNVLWSANTWNQLTSDLSGIVQEIVSQGGWVSNNSLSIIMKGIGTPFGRKFVTSYDGNPAFAPRLVIRYSVPNAPVPLIIVPPPAPVIVPTPPSAGFTSDVATGVAPLAVQFSNLSTGDIAGYAWDFGDGNSSADASPSHSYSAAGTYTVTLTVTGVDGTTSLAQAVITVSAPPPPPVIEIAPPPTEEAAATTTELPPEATTPP